MIWLIEIVANWLFSNNKMNANQMQQNVPNKTYAGL